MTPIVSVVGRSGSGKTTLLEKLIRELTARGRRVGTVKHHVHGRVQVDVPGKDSWRHRQAGAVAVSLASREELFLIRDVPQEPALAEIAHRLLFDVDIVLGEGFRSAPGPKIEVNRAALGVPLLCGAGDELVAVVADWATRAPVPHFGLEDTAPLAEFLERTFLPSGPPPLVELLAGGRRIGLDPAAAAGLARALEGLVGPEAGPVELRLRPGLFGS
ncbi:MAG: molybdopterin-guanine dinucleotide biosynthesis protein B [Candidatus Methylomirabilales bacterium]